MSPIRLLLTTGAIFLALNLAEAQNCDDGGYTLIDDTTRSTSYWNDYTLGLPGNCDRIFSAVLWYRFNSAAGVRIPELPDGEWVENDYCNTDRPIFINGTGVHDSIQDGQQVPAMVCDYGGTPGSYCNFRSTIQIYKCPAVDNETESFFIYQLAPPTICNLAYCAGDGYACAPGSYWTGRNCLDYLPPIDESPEFSGPFIDGDIGVPFSERIYFRCEIPFTSTGSSYENLFMFRITFLFNGEPLPDIGPDFSTLSPFDVAVSDDMHAELYEEHLRGRLGKTISCQVQSFWADVEENLSSVYYSQDSFLATIQCSDPFDFYFSNGGHQAVTYQSTLPLTCYYCTALPAGGCTSCEYRFEYSSTLATDGCKMVWENGQSADLDVFVIPQELAAAQIQRMTFKPFELDLDIDIALQSLWDTFVIPPCSVRINPAGSKFKVCSSSGDPHFTTFDGSKFNNYKSGGFYLAKSIDGNMEIQVRHKPCNTLTVTCNCGVIVREGNSVLKVSYCENTNLALTVRLLTQVPDDGSRILTDNTGRQFSIRMPSGLRVEASTFFSRADDSLSAPFLSISVYLPPAYHGKTDSDSCCGNSNGIPGDDLGSIVDDQERMRISFVPDAEDYFMKEPPCKNNNPPAMDCCTSSSTCTNKDPKINFLTSANSDASKWRSNKVCPPGADDGGADADYILDASDLYDNYEYDSSIGDETVFDWPTPLGKTEVQVQDYCQGVINSSPVAEACADIVDADTMNFLITSCVEDVQIADDWLDMSEYTAIMEQECILALTLAANITEGEDFIPPPELDSIYGQICPNQCSGNGTCSNAQCMCFEGFIGADCSINASAPPVLTAIVRRGLCDVVQRPCSVISVFGLGMVASPTLTCRFQDEDTEILAETTGTFVTSGEINCPVPRTPTQRRRKLKATDGYISITRFEITVSNDGYIYSDSIEFVVYDSICIQCDQNKVCSKKNDSCLIEKYCFASEEMKDDHTCQQCVPNQNETEWINQTVIGDWSLCSRDCDLGAQYRNIACSVDESILGTDSEQCMLTSCPPSPGEINEGVMISMSNDDLTKILLSPDDILEQVADAVNSYCRQNVDRCCQSVGISNGTSLSQFTSEDICDYASGFPSLEYPDPTVKIIVKTTAYEVQKRCECEGSVQSKKQKKMQKPQQMSICPADDVYADLDIVYDAVSAAQAVIEEALGITIISVNQPSIRRSAAHAVWRSEQ